MIICLLFFFSTQFQPTTLNGDNSCSSYLYCRHGGGNIHRLCISDIWEQIGTFFFILSLLDHCPAGSDHNKDWFLLVITVELTFPALSWGSKPREPTEGRKVVDFLPAVIFYEVIWGETRAISRKKKKKKKKTSKTSLVIAKQAEAYDCPCIPRRVR